MTKDKLSQPHIGDNYMADQDSKWPDGFVSEILALLDLIEIEDDPALARQRFEIIEKYGLTVKFHESV